MEELFSIQALVHYYDKASVDHAAVKRLLSSAKIDGLQLLLTDGSTTTLQNYVLIPRIERPGIADVIAYDGQSPATLATVVMLAEARAAADNMPTSSLELDIACSALERLLGSLSSASMDHPSLNTGFSVDKYALVNRIYRQGPAKRRYLTISENVGDTSDVETVENETPSSILSAINARLRLCDIATHCLAVVARQCVSNENKCREAVNLSTRLLSLANTVVSDRSTSPSASFSSRNSLRTALISGANNIGVIASENFDIDVSPWVRYANRLMLNNYSGSGHTQVIAAVFGGMIPICTEYRNAASDKSAVNVMMPLSIVHEVLEEQLNKVAATATAVSDMNSQATTQSGSVETERISKAAQSFLGERVVAAEEDGDEGRIAGGSGYNACENYIKRAGDGDGIKDLLLSLLLAAVKHCLVYQSQVYPVTIGQPEELDILSDGCTSNSEGHPPSVDLFENRPSMRGFGFRPQSTPVADNEQEATRSLSYHRKVAVLCIEALGSWLLLQCRPLSENQLSIVLDLLQIVCINASSLLVNRSIANFDVRATLANFGTICGSIFNDVRSPSEFWESNVSNIVRNSRHCIVLMKSMLRFCDHAERVRGVLNCYISEYFLMSETDAEDENKRKSSEDYLLYMMSLISEENSRDVLKVLAGRITQPDLLKDAPSKAILCHYAVTLHILDFLTKLTFGLNPSKSKTQITIVRLCNRANEGNEALSQEEITSQDELLSDEFAKVRPSDELIAEFKTIAPSLQYVLHRVAATVLSPVWNVQICANKNRSSARLSYFRGGPSRDVADIGESVLDAAGSLHQTIEHALRVSFSEGETIPDVPDAGIDPVVKFFNSFALPGGVPDIMSELLEELQRSIESEVPVPLSLLYRLECCAKALGHQDSKAAVSIPTLIQLLDGCLKKFSTIVPIGLSSTLPISDKTAGLFGKKWYEELAAPKKIISKATNNESIDDEHYSPVKDNLTIAVRYSEHLRGEKVEDLVKGVLDKLAALVQQAPNSSTSYSQEQISMLTDITALCWPVYQTIASFMFSLLSDYVAKEVSNRDPELDVDPIEITGMLLRVSSWRLFIHEAPGCVKTLHNLCHFAHQCLESSDFDERALALALCDDETDSIIPSYILDSIRPNSMHAMMPELLTCSELSAIVVQPLARALNSLTAACKSSSVWRSGFVSSLYHHVTSFESPLPEKSFFSDVIQRSVIDTDSLSNSIFAVIDVLGQNKSERSLSVLRAIFKDAAHFIETQLLSTPRSSLYRVLELIIRSCAAYEEAYMGMEARPSARTYILTDFVQLLTRCIKQLNTYFKQEKTSDNANKLAVVLMGLLHLCRKGHDTELEARESKSKSIPLPLKPDSSQHNDEVDNKSPPKRSSKRMKQMISDCSGRSSDPKAKSKSKPKPKPPKKSSRDSDLCTFTTTGDQFVEQYWYFCYTCGLTGTEGVCTVCARRCHAGHEIAYSRHSRFFCDCGAAGSEPNPVPPPPHPTGSSDSEVSVDRREYTKREKRSSPKRRRCISLTHNPEHSDSSSSSRPDLMPRPEPLERAVIRNKDTSRPSEEEMNLLNFASPLIGQCLSSYSTDDSGMGSDNDFESCIKSSETVNCVLDLAQCLLDQDDFFGDENDGNSENNVSEKWKPIHGFSSVDVADPIIECANVADNPPGRLVRALKGGGFSFPSKHSKTIKTGLFGVPMALSCFSEYLALGQEKGTVLIVKASALMSCKSPMERSSLLRMGEVVVPFNVRHLAFHPENEEVLLIVGDTSVCVVILSFHPFVERTRLQLELGLNLFDEAMDVGVHPTANENSLIGAEWVSGRDCAVIVKTKAFVKVFDVKEDNVSPFVFIPTDGKWNSPEQKHNDKSEEEEAPEECRVDVTSNNVVDIFSVKSLGQGNPDLVLLAVTEKGDVLLSRMNDGERNFESIMNVLVGLTDGNSTTVVSVTTGFDPHVFIVLCSNGWVLRLRLRLRSHEEIPQLSVDPPLMLQNVFTSSSNCVAVSLMLFGDEACYIYERGSTLSTSGILVLDGKGQAKKHFFTGSHSGKVVGAVNFLPSTVFGKPCRSGCFVLLDDGGVYRVDMSMGLKVMQFVSDPETSEMADLISEIQKERTMSKQSLRNRRVLVQDRYNPVPSTIGFFEKARLVQDTARVRFGSGTEQGGTESEMKFALGGNTTDFIMSSAPYLSFQLTISCNLHGTNSVLVGARLKFGGSDRSKHRVPRVVRVFGREVRWTPRNGTKRWLDIPFTVLESSKSPKQVTFEFESCRPHPSDSSASDGLVAIDNVQLYQIPHPEFAERKAMFENEAAVFNDALKSTTAESNLDDVESSDKLLSTTGLYKHFDSRYAAALSAIDLAIQGSELPLEAAARLCLSIGSHSLQFVRQSRGSVKSLALKLEESRRRLQYEALKSEFERSSDEQSSFANILSAFSSACRAGVLKAVENPLRDGSILVPRLLEMAIYSVRSVSSVWVTICSMSHSQNYKLRDSLIDNPQTTESVDQCFQAMIGMSQAEKRLCMSARKRTENLTDALLISLVMANCSNPSNDPRIERTARHLVQVMCDRSRAARLFSSRRMIDVLREPSKLMGMNETELLSEDVARNFAFCLDVNSSSTSTSKPNELAPAESPAPWRYRCNNCGVVCDKEWWHSVDCEDYDLCTKCVRGDRKKLKEPNLESHMLIRGDPEHDLDEMNNENSLSFTELKLLEAGFSALLVQLAKVGRDSGPESSLPVFLEAAQMLSSVVSLRTKYPLRVKYMELLCSSSELIARVMRTVGSIVSNFSSLRTSCPLKENAKLNKDWEFAFLFLQVFGNVRDAVLLPSLFRNGIPNGFALVLRELEPFVSDVFRHAASSSVNYRADSVSKLNHFCNVWNQMSSSVAGLRDDDPMRTDTTDFVCPPSSVVSPGGLSLSVTAFLQLSLHIIDFLSFALQNASGPEVDEVMRTIPRDFLCSLVASDTRDIRLKGNPLIQSLILRSKKLLLVVSGKDESSMHRTIDSHVYRTHILDIKNSMCEVDETKSPSKYAIQVEVTNSLKSLHRLVSKRPATWREFCTKNVELLKVVLDTLSICDNQTQGLALQLIMVACSLSSEMACDSLRSSSSSTSPRMKKSDGMSLKSKKSGDDSRDLLESRDTFNSSKSAYEPDSILRSYARPEWVTTSAQSSVDEDQVSLDLLCENDFARLKVLIFTLLMQRQSSIIRIAVSRILCCVIARTALSNSPEMMQGLYSTLIKALRNMPASGSLGTEFGHTVEVFVSFCNEGYFECLGADRVKRLASMLVDSLRSSASSLVSHPNAHIYKSLANVVDLPGYYLEAEPCATCSIEAFESSAPAVQRLEAIRVEAKYTDCEIMCRLTSAQAVSGVSVKVVDPRRTRRVKKIDVYYSPRIVSDSTELKSAAHPWHHFANISLSPTQTEGKVELSVPISTANLRFRFSEFYTAEESANAVANDRDTEAPNSSRGDDHPSGETAAARGSLNVETLQCPRCSRTVTDKYGICRNCHENAYQCRQCRNINYENLDGFLCNECGYCKHARFEFSVTCKSSFVAEKVCCEEDRKRAGQIIEKETAEIHRKHEELKKMRTKVLKALSLGPKGAGELEFAKEEPPPPPKSLQGYGDVPIRADIATLEALLGGHLPHDSSEGIPIALDGGPPEMLLGTPASLDLPGRSGRDPRRVPSHPLSFLAKKTPVAGHEVISSLSSAALSRQTSRLAILYAKDCKALFMGMSQSIRVLSASRHELVQYSASSLKRSAVKDGNTGLNEDGLPKEMERNALHSNIRASPCYGCTQSFLANCVDLLHAIVQSGSEAAAEIRTPELAVEMLKLSTLCERKEVQTRIRKLIVNIVSGNTEASDLVCGEISKKIEFCIDSFSSVDARSVARLELALLEDIALIEDTNWEKRFRTVILLLFRASKVSLSCASISETIILPCLRIALHLLRVEEGVDPFQEPADCLLPLELESPSEPAEEPARSSLLDIDSALVDSTSGDGNIASPTDNLPSIVDGSESVASSDNRHGYRLESDHLSVSGAPSSISTAFEEHPSDDESQTKQVSQSAVDVSAVVDTLKDDHEVGVNGVRIEHWLSGYQSHEDWLIAMASRRKSEKAKMGSEEGETHRTTRWWFNRWRANIRDSQPLNLTQDWGSSWAVRLVLLAPCPQVRESASTLIQTLICSEEVLHMRLIDSLTGSALDKACMTGDSSKEYFQLLSKLVRARRSKLYLIAKGFPSRLVTMIYSEAKKLLDVEDSLNGVHTFSLSYGFVLHELSSILKTLLEEVTKMRESVRVKIFESENDCVVKSLQQAYLFVRRLLSLRTRLTEESGEILCELLSSSDYLFYSSTGVKVVHACVTELKNAHARDDAHTVSVLLEQLCDMLCPETSDPVCYLTLNKSPTQDEFIRGAMSKNPYSSTSFSGPLMRDVKNKICEDLDLPALLEDDSGMELLVADNVIKLDLPIMAVYEQVWRNSPHANLAAASPAIQRTYGSRGSSVSGLSTGSIHPLDVIQASRRRDFPARSLRTGEERVDPPMTVIYRLAGLDGMATEPIIDALQTESQEDMDLEAMYKTTEMLGDVGGLDVLLALLSVVGSWGDDAETAVREPALKLLRACCEVSKNRSILAATSGTLSTLLDCAASAFEHAHNSMVAVESAESLLIASEKILAEKSLGGEVLEHDLCSQTNVDEVLSRMQVFLGRLSVVSSTKAEASILHLLPFLMQGIPAAVDAAIQHFQFDWNVVADNKRHWKVACQFATVLVAAPCDYRGQAIILRALEDDCASKAVSYLMTEFPMPKVENKDTWERTLKHDGPPAALKVLKGLTLGCSPTMTRRLEMCDLIAKALSLNENTIAMLCQLEMTASSHSVGSLAEELLGALLQNEKIADQVELERRNLRDSRRKAAEASRQAILKETGLFTPIANEENTGTGNNWMDMMDMFDDVIDEVGPACVVCGDGFRSRPNEVLGIYVLSRRAQIDTPISSMLSAFTTPSTTLPAIGRSGLSRRDSEPHMGGSRSRSVNGGGSGSFCYSTVTQFNAIHLSCHRDAARSDRGSRREEWEGATLRNSQTICNNIIPLHPPVLCSQDGSPSDGYNAASASLNVATEYYLTRLIALGRSVLPPVKLVLHDLGRVLIRFSHGGTQVFSEHSKGGGPHSNACLLPHLILFVIHLMNTSTSGGGVREGANELARISEMEKYLKEEETGDIAYHLAVALVAVSVTQWRRHMTAFLRLALREVDTPETALRLIAFADTVNVHLKQPLGDTVELEALRVHVGSDETFSANFADTVIAIWETKIKQMMSAAELLEVVQSSNAAAGTLPEDVVLELQDVLDSID